MSRFALPHAVILAKSDLESLSIATLVLRMGLTPLILPDKVTRELAIAIMDPNVIPINVTDQHISSTIQERFDACLRARSVTAVHAQVPEGITVMIERMSRKKGSSMNRMAHFADEAKEPFVVSLDYQDTVKFADSGVLPLFTTEPGVLYPRLLKGEVGSLQSPFNTPSNSIRIVMLLRHQLWINGPSIQRSLQQRLLRGKVTLWSQVLHMTTEEASSLLNYFAGTTLYSTLSMLSYFSQADHSYWVLPIPSKFLFTRSGETVRFVGSWSSSLSHTSVTEQDPNNWSTGCFRVDVLGRGMTNLTAPGASNQEIAFCRIPLTELKDGLPFNDTLVCGAGDGSIPVYVGAKGVGKTTSTELFSVKDHTATNAFTGIAIDVPGYVIQSTFYEVGPHSTDVIEKDFVEHLFLPGDLEVIKRLAVQHAKDLNKLLLSIFLFFKDRLESNIRSTVFCAEYLKGIGNDMPTSAIVTAYLLKSQDAFRRSCSEQIVTIYETHGKGTNPAMFFRSNPIISWDLQSIRRLTMRFKGVSQPIGLTPILMPMPLVSEWMSSMESRECTITQMVMSSWLYAGDDLFLSDGALIHPTEFPRLTPASLYCFASLLPSIPSYQAKLPSVIYINYGAKRWSWYMSSLEKIYKQVVIMKGFTFTDEEHLKMFVSVLSYGRETVFVMPIGTVLLPQLLPVVLYDGADLADLAIAAAYGVPSVSIRLLSKLALVHRKYIFNAGRKMPIDQFTFDSFFTEHEVGVSSVTPPVDAAPR